jgi:hypothetical protein
MNNFISTFEELSKLYEEAPKVEKNVKKSDEEAVEESCAKEELVEAAEDEEIEIVDDEAAIEEIPEEDPIEEPIEEDEPRQVIIKCAKCGALVIKDEADIVPGEESELVNLEDACEFCEEAEGHEIVGVVAPYEVAEDVAEEAPIEEVAEEEFVEEGLLDIPTPAKTVASII